MSTLRAGDREFHTLAAGQVLTVVAAAASAGIVRQYPDTGFNATSSQAVSAGASLTVGPFTGSVRLGVECALGRVDWTAGLPAYFPAPALSDSKVAAVDSLVSAAGNFTVNSRDGLGRATSFTDSSGTTYTVTYGNFGPVTVSGGGQTRTYSYNAAGQMTGFAAS